MPQEEKRFVLKTLFELLQTGIGLFALCEVSEDDIQSLTDAASSSKYRVTPYLGSREVGNFGMAVIWNLDQLEVRSHEYIVDVVRGYRKRIAVRLEVRGSDGFEFRLFLVHWPSRLHMDEESSSREFLGDRLRRSIDQERKLGSENIIVMGDFNDEPFNDALTSGLRSTRDPARACRQTDILYNPFWRHMSPLDGHVWDRDQSERRGTYYHRGHQLDRWRLLDQILFSAAFVHAGEWQMVEEGTRVFQNETLMDIVESARFKIDHMPILGEIRKKR